MRTANVHEAKTQFSKLLARAAKGERIVIARNGVPIAELHPYRADVAPVRRLGEDRGKVRIADDFNAPLADSVLEDFER